MTYCIAPIYAQLLAWLYSSTCIGRPIDRMTGLNAMALPRSGGASRETTDAQYPHTRRDAHIGLSNRIRSPAIMQPRVERDFSNAVPAMALAWPTDIGNFRPGILSQAPNAKTLGHHYPHTTQTSAIVSHLLLLATDRKDSRGAFLRETSAE